MTSMQPMQKSTIPNLPEGIEIRSDPSPSNRTPKYLERKHTATLKSAFSYVIRPGLDRLLGDSIFIQQKINKMEALTGCSEQNRYFVYGEQKWVGKKGHKLFTCREKSGCISRNCMPGSARPFNIVVCLAEDDAGGDDDDYDVDVKPFLMLERPCKCTCLCIGRPEITVTIFENGSSRLLGTIRNPLSCSLKHFEVFDSKKTLKYIIDTPCCQFGLCFKAPCDSCQTVDFDIRSPAGEKLSVLHKKTAGCLQNMFTDADNFTVNFPSDASKEDKALFMASALFIDSRFFNTSASPEDPTGGYGNTI